MIALDIETDGLNPRKNKVIGFSYSDGKKSRYICHLKWENSTLVEVYSKRRCIAILNWMSKQRLVMHNAAFDVQFIKNYFGVDLLPALHCDTMLLAHFNDENKMSYGLKELGAELLGADAKEEQTILKEHLKSKGAGPKEFYKADLDIIAKYARKDVDLTMRLYNILTPELKNPELFYGEIMEVYKEVVIPMQARGVQFDVSKAFDYLIAISSDIQQIKSDILREIAPHLDKFYAIYYDHNYPLKSRGLVADKMKLGMTLLEAQKAVAKDKGDEGFNIQSKHHLSQLFFDIMQLTPLSYTDKKAPQVDEDFLESIKGEYNFAANLILYNKLNKIKSTYYERFLDEHEDGIFYPQYYLHRTVSGRLSSDFQQLPRPLESGHPLLMKYNNIIRELFIARPGHIIIGCDWSQLEPRCFASESGDQALIDIFKNDLDFYSVIGINVLKIDASAKKSDDNFLGKINKTARQQSKAFSLGLAYGMDDYKLHKDLGISQNEAKIIVNNYMRAFPSLAEKMRRNKEKMLKEGIAETRFGRIRRQPNIPYLYKKHGDAILNALDLWKKYNESPAIYAQAKNDYKVVRHALNNCLNFPIQGLAAHLCNRACINIARRIKDIDAHIIAQIHDEIIVECLDIDKQKIADIIKEEMELGTKIEVPLEAEPAFGNNLLEAK